MSFKKASLVAMLAVSMASTPVLAQAATSASSLSVAGAEARVGADVNGASEMNGGFIIPLLAALAVIGGIIAATSGGGDNPTSP